MFVFPHWSSFLSVPSIVRQQLIMYNNNNYCVLWINQSREHKNPPGYGQATDNWKLSNKRVGILTQQPHGLFTTTINKAVQVATKCPLLRRPIVISWCFMRIIHPCLVHGRGVTVFHIVEFLVFSAHIMKWDCHPTMRSVRCQWWTGRKRASQRDNEREATTFMNQRRKARRTSWVIT